MKTIATFAALAVTALLVGCSTTPSTAPGAVGTAKSECCATKAAACTAAPAAAAPGAVGTTKSGCCSAAAKSAPGAVGATKTECTGVKTEGTCTAKCPATKG